jgi:hypothetical protein
MKVELDALKKKKLLLSAELKNYERSDPAQLIKMNDDMKMAKDAVNRWTDNLNLVMQWIQDVKPGIS